MRLVQRVQQTAKNKRAGLDSGIEFCPLCFFLSMTVLEADGLAQLGDSPQREIDGNGLRPPLSTIYAVLFCLPREMVQPSVDPCISVYDNNKLQVIYELADRK